jgi:hypothetical protein
MMLCIGDFEWEGEKIRAGIDRVDESHEMVRQFPHHFAQTRSPRFMMRNLSPSAANLADPARTRKLNEADLRQDGFSELQIQRALNGDQTVVRGPGRGTRPSLRKGGAKLPRKAARLP